MSIKLNEIRDNPGARREKKRLGRGIGSGLGKTSGRGGKGQTARSGVSINGFEGGQNPIYRRLPKRGFNNIHAQPQFELTLKKLNEAVVSGKLDVSKVIDRDALIAANLMCSWEETVSLFGTGELKHKVQLEVNRASKSAVSVVEKAGGTVKIA